MALGTVKSSATCKSCTASFAAGESRWYQSGVGYVCDGCMFGVKATTPSIVEPLIFG